MTSRSDVIVIGAGHNGLVAAAYLAKSGLNVVCLEAAALPGGMAASRTLADNYHFSGLAHTAYELLPAIRRELKLDNFGYAPGRSIDTVALDADGNHLTISRNAISGNNLADSDTRAWPAFMEQFESYAKALRPLFENSPPRLKDMPFGDKATLAKMAWNIRVGLGRERMYEFLRVVAMNIYDVLDDEFVDDRLKGAIAADAVMGNAMGPRTPGSVLTWLQRMQGSPTGRFSQLAGSGLINSLIHSAESLGVDIQTNARVVEILTADNKAFGVKLEDDRILKANRVVSALDPRSTFLNLLGARNLDAMFAHRVSQIRGSGVVGKLNIALNGLPEFADLPESQLGDRLIIAPSSRFVESAFNASKYNECSDSPVLEITIPSLHDASLAPEGHHSMSVNIAYMPHTLKGGWDEARTSFAYKIIAQLGQYAPELKTLVVDYELLTPLDIEQQYGAVNGHWHHGELSIHQSFMMRPLHGAAQYGTPVNNLFLCGAGSHPGGGLTGLPGHNAAKRILGLGDPT